MPFSWALRLSTETTLPSSLATRNEGVVRRRAIMGRGQEAAFTGEIRDEEGEESDQKRL